MESLMLDSETTSNNSRISGVWWKMAVCSVILIGIGFINELTRISFDYTFWIDTLNKPSFSPNPKWIIGPIWTLMYILMGISLGIIWQRAKMNKNLTFTKNIRNGFVAFTVQIFINMLVPLFFFGFNNLNLVLIGVILNVIALAFVMYYFSKVSKAALYFLIPYLIWLLYATALDTAYVYLN